MQKDALRALIATRMAVALIPTAVAIPVAVLATCSYNYLRTHVDLLESEVFGEGQLRGRHFRGSLRFPPTKLFSGVPAFGLIAGPVLAILIAGFMTFGSFHTSKGLYVGLAPVRCEYDGHDQHIVLHITGAGKLFLNHEQEDWNGLADRLSAIYSIRKQRTLYLLADSDVPFRTVANVVDIVENAPAAVEAQSADMRIDKLGINVRLVTPQVLNAGCPEPVVIGAAGRGLR